MEWTREARYTALDERTQARYEALAAQAAKSVWRQWFHVQPPAGLLNDPNGFCWHQGQYYLFYQWFPLGPVHGLKYWYHLTSVDLVHFQAHGIGIAPDTRWDSHGAYSGSALSHGDALWIAYTGNHRTADWQRIPYQIMAILDDNGLRKSEPFLHGAPEGYTEHVRDPKIWREADGSYGLVLGAQRTDLTGAALYMTSADGAAWQLEGEIDCALPNFGYMWECPDYFALDGQDVLLFCPQGVPREGERFCNIYQSGYILGHFDKAARHFAHDGFFELDHGFDFYAPQTCVGANGERLLIGWMGLPDMACPSDRDGWAHCLTLPRVLSVENGRLMQRPLPALQRLRGTGEADGVHVEMLLDNPNNQSFSVQVRGCTLTFDGEYFTFDRSMSGLLPEPEIEAAEKGGHVRRLPLSHLTQLQIFSDTSSLEVFINDGCAVMSARIYPQASSAPLQLDAPAGVTHFIYPLKEATWRSMPSAKH